jgi:uncharacterized damage-inducible protein DinB
MNPADRSQMLRMLAESRDQLVDATTGVSDEQAKTRPAPDRWSILECVEHVGRAENGMFGMLTTQMVPSGVAGDRSREEFLIRGAVDRNQRVAAPDRAHPVGRFATLAEALDDFREKHRRTLAYIEECAEDLRSCSMQHPVVGPCTGQEFLILMALHPARHAKQIREVRANLGLP